jgi:radical SAM protein with 4Fe4S-binding SPASM domain
MSRIASALLRSWQALERRDHELLYLFFEITRACDLACRHCGSDCRREPKAPSLSAESWMAIADDLRERFGTRPFIVITGGEPLTHPKLLDIGAHLCVLGLSWGMVSNARAWRPGLMDELLAAGISSLTFSLDGPAESHAWLRRDPESYGKAIGAIREAAAAKAAGFVFDVVTCVHPGNLELLGETAEILIAAGARAWRLFRIFPAGRAGRDPELELDAAGTERLLDWIGEHRPALSKRGLELSYSCEGWFPRPREKLLRPQPSFCRSGVNFASILSDGTIAGCPNNHPSFNQGNVLSDSFSRVWRDGFIPHRRREWLAASACGDCRQLRDCRGGALHLWREGREAPAFCYHRRTAK